MPADLAILADRSFRGVIFDLDGTLVDSIPAMVRSWTTWAIEYGVTAEQLQGFHGVPAEGVVATLLAPDQVGPALRRISELEEADVDGVVPLPGARAALEALAAGHAAIATSCHRRLAEARIGAAGLTPPEVLVTVDDVARGKPAPDPFLLAADRLGIAATDCLVVEDAAKGVQAARSAGCAVLAVLVTTPAEELPADAIVTDLSAVRFVCGPDGIRVVAADRATTEVGA